MSPDLQLGKKKKNVKFIKRFCYGYIRAMFSYSISSSWPPLLSLVCLCFPASSLESESEMTLPLTWLPVSISIHTTPDSHNTHTHTHARTVSFALSRAVSDKQTQPIASFSLTAKMDHPSTAATNQGWKGWRSHTWGLTWTHLSHSHTHTNSRVRQKMFIQPGQIVPRFSPAQSKLKAWCSALFRLWQDAFPSFVWIHFIESFFFFHLSNNLVSLFYFTYFMKDMYSVELLKSHTFQHPL